MKINYLGFVMTLLILMSCSKATLNKKTSESYFEKIAIGEYMETENYLSPQFTYEDVIFKQTWNGRTEYVNYLAPDSAKHYACEKILKIESVDSDNDSMVYVKGEFCGYRYKDFTVKAMRFVSILYFNKEGKIYKQEDWKDYALEDILEMYQFRNSFIN